MNWNDTTTWRVLIVDDEPDNLEIVAETLEYEGINIKTAANGKAALEALEDFPATLIITDLSMPVMNGWDLRARVKRDSRFADVTVIALSAHAIAGDKERALEAGFDGYITKPIHIFSLVNDIRLAAGQPMKQDQEAAL
jgi:two-component system cell cycle response regulator DivK